VINDDISRAAIARALPTEMRLISQRVATAVDEDFAELPSEDRELCIAVCVATAVLELDRAGRLNIPPRDAAWLYQIGRVGAQELPATLHPRLQKLLTRPDLVYLWRSEAPEVAGDAGWRT
jgi:hypothetical protein